MAEGLSKRCKNGQNLMESNGGKTKIRSLGTSLAFQQTKEHPHRSLGVEVMTENVVDATDSGRAVRTGSAKPVCTGPPVHRVLMARVHGVLEERTNSS